MKKINFIISVLFILNTILADIFIPENNDELNYRQIEFSWPQIPNSENYVLIIKNTSEQIIYDINTENNIIINDGYNLDWGKEYIWKVCGYNKDTLTECHEEKFFRLSNIHDFIPEIFEINKIDEQQIDDGLTIIGGYFQSEPQGFAFDKNGEVLWFILNKNFRRLLKNGNILTIGTGQEPIHQELNLRGEVIYSSSTVDENGNEISFHHDISKSFNDTYFTLSNIYEVHDCPSECDPLLSILNPGGMIWEGDIIREYDKNNNLKWDWNLFEHIGVQNYTTSDLNIGPGEGTIDWTHSNEVFYDENENAVYLSIRNLNTITKIDYDTKEVIWHLGDLDTLNSTTIDSYFNEHPSFSRQHTPILLENNNLLIFDNGTHNNPKISKCQEYSINNNSFELVWEYALHDSLHSSARGECYYLNNGNTLIATGWRGNVIEINNQNDLVWHVVINSTEGSNLISRTQRVENLHPSSFNILFNNYKGSIDNPIVEVKDDNILSFDIINNGWLDDEYKIEINEFNKIINISSNSSKKIDVQLDEIFNFEIVSDNLAFTEYIDIHIYSKNQDKTTTIKNILITKVTIPSDFTITKAFPNPFNPNINFKIEIPEKSYIELNIFDINGRLVNKIFNNNILFGEHTFTWDASNFSSGIYLLNLKSNSTSKTTKITLIK